MVYIQFARTIVKHGGQLDESLVSDIDNLISTQPHHFLPLFHSFIQKWCGRVDIWDFLEDFYEGDRCLEYVVMVFRREQEFLTDIWKLAKYGHIIFRALKANLRYKQRKWLNAIFKKTPSFSGLHNTYFKVSIARFLGCA